MADNERLLLYNCIAGLNNLMRRRHKYQLCSTLSFVVTSNKHYELIVLIVPLLTWCCCIQSIVSEMYVDLELIANTLTFSKNGAANGGAIIALCTTKIIKHYIAKRNLLDECLHPHTCQILTTLQIPAHVPNCHIDANTHARTKSPYRHIHLTCDKSPYKPMIVCCLKRVTLSL